MLPNFLIIGAPRSGTTWIDENLREHPEVLMASVKEVHFFDRHYDRGIGYYESFFEGWRGQKAVGEATPAYLHGQFTERDIPQLVRQHLPGAKLIASLRNPVERVWSEFWNGKANDARNVGLSFEDKLEQRPQFIREGFYDEQLERYFALFPPEQILVLFHDDMRRDAHAFMARIYDFLGVNADFHAKVEAHRKNQSSGKRRLARSQLLWHASRALGRLRLHGIAERLWEANSIRLPPMKLETAQRLVEIYRPHNERLARMVGRDLGHWNEVPRSVIEAQAARPRGLETRLGVRPAASAATSRLREP